MFENVKDSLFISDLHSERGFNPQIHALLRGKASSRDIYFLGDARMYPDSYKDIPHTAIKGNHEYMFDIWRKGLQKYVLLTPEVLLIHGHNAEKQNKFPNRYFKDIVDFFMTHKEAWQTRNKLLSCSSPLGLKYTIPQGMASTPEWLRLCALRQRLYKHFPRVKTVLMGHHHVQYSVKAEDCDFYNCGAGFRGEHIEIVDGELYFYN
ncbi:hypothetical protein LCGC14_2067160 [marine sediment metagenome]|uniref:Uncharacterized protein n=1 Tax=marine sediment metagenome TaxID=412755 RepID=A0A0F9F6T1_9ZZZZ